MILIKKTILVFKLKDKKYSLKANCNANRKY